MSDMNIFVKGNRGASPWQFFVSFLEFNSLENGEDQDNGSNGHAEMSSPVKDVGVDIIHKRLG